MQKLKEKPKDKPKNAEEASEAMLMGALDFTPAALAANQQGKLSGDQKARLVRRRTQTAWLTVLSGLIGYGSAAIVFTKIVAHQDPILSVFIAGIAIAISINCARHWRRFDREIRTGKVLAAQGQIVLIISLSNYFLHINGPHGLHMKVRKDVFLAFKNGEHYTVYYTPRSLTVLSAKLQQD